MLPHRLGRDENTRCMNCSTGSPEASRTLEAIEPRRWAAAPIYRAHRLIYQRGEVQSSVTQVTLAYSRASRSVRWSCRLEQAHQLQGVRIGRAVTGKPEPPQELQFAQALPREPFHIRLEEADGLAILRTLLVAGCAVQFLRWLGFAGTARCPDALQLLGLLSTGLSKPSSCRASGSAVP